MFPHFKNLIFNELKQFKFKGNLLALNFKSKFKVHHNLIKKQGFCTIKEEEK